MTVDDPTLMLRRLFDAAVAAADPAQCVPPHLPEPPKGRAVVVGAGKASAAMARAVEDHWPGNLSGLVVTRYGCAVPCERIEIVEAAHPVPDASGLEAAGRILGLAQSLGPDDLMLCLISGGGSALLSLPAVGLTFDVSRIQTREQASALIEKLRLLGRCMNGRGYDAELRDRRVAFGMATKLVFRRYREQQRDPTKWRRFWKDVECFYRSYQEQQELAISGGAE